MSFEVLNKAIGMLDADIIEAAEKAPERETVLHAFAKRPWMNWAVAAVLIIVIGVGTPVALRMMGVFRNENFVSPSGGSGNSGFIAPADGSSESSSGQSPEGESSSKADEPSSSGETPSSSSDQPGGSSSETPDVSSSGTSESDVPKLPEGDFVKDNMPAVTYRINGEYKTFDYQSSTAVVDSGSNYVIDCYVGSDCSNILVISDSGELMQYNAGIIDNYYENVLASEEEAIKAAERCALSTDIPLYGLESLNTSVKFLGNAYSIILTTSEESIEIIINQYGVLLSLVVKK